MKFDTLIQITHEGRADGWNYWRGQKFWVVADRRVDGTPVCFMLPEGNVLPATHAVELTVDDRTRKVVGRAPRLAKKAIVDNIVAWGVK